MDYLTRRYVGWFLRHPLEAAFRAVRWMNINADVQERAMFYNAVMGLPDRVAARFAAELAYIEEKGEVEVFPYEVMRARQSTSVGEEGGYSYAMHKGMRLYYPRGVSPQAAGSEYDAFVNDEGILGTGVRRCSPHSYVAEDFGVDSDSVVVDIGAAEGLFALNCVHDARQVYLFECERRWRRPLEKTFAPFGDKTRIINKFVSDRTCGRETRLSDALSQLPPEANLFIKLDVEGAERKILSASIDFLKCRKTKIACCAYHRQDDAAVLSRLLEKAGFRVSYSEGWMLLKMNGIRYPYFRRGVVRAVNG